MADVAKPLSRREIRALKNAKDHQSVVPSRDEVWAVVRDANQGLRAGDDVWARITDGVRALYADALDAKDAEIAKVRHEKDTWYDVYCKIAPEFAEQQREIERLTDENDTLRRMVGTCKAPPGGDNA